MTNCGFYQDCNHVFLRIHCVDRPGLWKLCSCLASGAVFSLPPDVYSLFVERWNFFFVYFFTVSSEHTVEARTGNCIHHFNSPAVYWQHYAFQDFQVSTFSRSKCSTLLYLGLFFISPIFHALNAFFCNIFGFLLVCFTGILRWVKRCIIYEPTFFLQHFRFVPTAILSSSVTIRFPWPFFLIVLIPQLYWCFCIGRTSKFRQCFILLVSDDVFCIFHEISLFFRCSDSIFNI